MRLAPLVRLLACDFDLTLTTCDMTPFLARLRNVHTGAAPGAAAEAAVEYEALYDAYATSRAAAFARMGEHGSVDSFVAALEAQAAAVGTIEESVVPLQSLVESLQGKAEPRPEPEPMPHTQAQIVPLVFDPNP